ncbi:hypothetical protein [Thauera sinica]|uniref:PBP domain-containing protein n=1 Tax=Thauera sinica TaxID=2665146 RepID=A0ABW1APD9_9RHOO|nr:hypothetical protein [Thauera sp. K11]ATE60507.1 hypothetical protein CCZ27_11615 [Thauera sp. K11]
MKLKQIALGCSLACAAFAANAAYPTAVNISGHTVITMGGASAPDNFLADIASSLMTGVTEYRGRNPDGSADNNFRAFKGAANGIPGIANGTLIVFQKRSQGGSVMGVDPVARGARIEFIDFSKCDDTTTPVRCDTKGIDPGLADHEDPALNGGLIVDFGIADVEPAMFREPLNTENNQPELSSEERAVLTNVPVNQIMMGLVASAAVPNSVYFSKALYGAILSGKINNWKQVDASLSDQDNVLVCRRVSGSGTQTSYNAYFNNFPCANGALGQTAPATLGDGGLGEALTGGSGTQADPYVVDPSLVPGQLLVIENSGSGDVRNCLANANDKVDHTVLSAGGEYYKYEFSKLANPGKAVGILSLDSYASSGANTKWSFRTLDGAGSFNGSTQTTSIGATGVAPSKANLVDGKYDFVVELSMQYRNVAVTNVQGDSAPALSGTKLAFFNEFVKRAGSTKYTGNDGGTFTAVPNAYATLPTVDSYVTKPTLVNKYSRGGNTCAPLKRF